MWVETERRSGSSAHPVLEQVMKAYNTAGNQEKESAAKKVEESFSIVPSLLAYRQRTQETILEGQTFGMKLIAFSSLGIFHYNFIEVVG